MNLYPGDIVRVTWMPNEEIDRIASQYGVKRSKIRDHLRTSVVTVKDFKISSASTYPAPAWAMRNSKQLHAGVLVVELEIGEAKLISYLESGCVRPVFTL